MTRFYCVRCILPQDVAERPMDALCDDCRTARQAEGRRVWSALSRRANAPKRRAGVFRRLRGALR